MIAFDSLYMKVGLRMSELRFVQIQKEKPKYCDVFMELMMQYMKELNENEPRIDHVSEDIMRKYAQSCINIQGSHDRYLELTYIGDEPVGFLYGKVDHEGDRGYIKPEYGYIIEFYVNPSYRRKGYGKVMFQRLEQHFAGHGVKRMYLTSCVTGDDFWKAVGFVETGEISPDNDMMILEKEITKTP